jgi:flavin-dependent dehydrogenase
MKSINILGAGLSGLTAAINFSKQGYDVNVFEKRSDCGKRFLGDLEGLENWSSKINVLEELNKMNIKNNFDYTPFKKISVSNGKEKIDVNLKKTMFYLVKRGPVENSLDLSLKNQALDLGANIHFKCKKTEKNMDIISTGPAVKKYVGVVKGIRFETESDDIALLLLNNEASANGAYSYLLVSNGYGCICSVNIYVSVKEANKYFKKTYEIITKLVDIDIKNQKNVGGIGCFLLNPILKKNDKLYTGEAAGLQDVLWGFGMRYAMISGYLAALSIIENKNYKRLIKKEIGDRLKTSIVNRYLTDKYYHYVHNYIFNIVRNNPGNWMDMLYKRFNPTLYSRVLYPYAKIKVTQRLKSYYKNRF